jgi:hypothetical protein
MTLCLAKKKRKKLALLKMHEPDSRNTNGNKDDQQIGGKKTGGPQNRGIQAGAGQGNGRPSEEKRFGA